MINKRYSKKESKGLPGGPHEQFTYVTGVFMQDMYHVPKAQDGFESLTQNSFNLMDSNPNYFASDEELVRKEEQKRREWNIRRQMMLEDEYKNLDKDPRSIAFQKNIQQLKNERIEDRIKKSKEEQKNRPKYKPNKAYDLNPGTWDIQHPKSYYRDNWDRLNPETKKRELTYHIDDFLKYTPDDLKKYKKLRAKGRDYENEKDATEENILFLRKMDAKLDAQENIGDKIKRGRPTSKQMQKLVLDWADKYDAGYNNQYNTAAELTVPFGTSSFMMDDQSEYNEQMRGYDVNNLSEQEKQWEKERLESVLKQQSLDIDFRYGGNIPKAQKGFEQPILYVDSEDDERNQLYQDSFQLYNASLAQKKIFGNGPWVPGVGTVDKTDIKGDLPENSSFSQTEAEYDRRNRLNNKTSKYLKNKELIKKYKNLGFTDDTIKYYDTIPEVFNPLINPTSAYLPTPTTPRFVYQKPHTKVVVRPSINSKTPVVQKKEPSYRVHDFFKHHGMDPSYKSRSEAAKAYGIDNYGGTEEQNKKLIELMLPNYPLDKKLMPRAQKGGDFQRLVKKYTTKGWASLNPQEQQFYRETYQRGGEEYKNYVYPLGDNTYQATPYSLPVAEVWGNPINTGRQLTKTIGKGVTNLGKNVLEGLAIPEALFAYGVDKYRGKNTELADVFPSMFSDMADRQHKGQPDVVTSVTSDDWVRENPGKALAAGFLGFPSSKGSKISKLLHKFLPSKKSKSIKLPDRSIGDDGILLPEINTKGLNKKDIEIAKKLWGEKMADTRYINQPFTEVSSRFSNPKLFVQKYKKYKKEYPNLNDKELSFIIGRDEDVLKASDEFSNLKHISTDPSFIDFQLQEGLYDAKTNLTPLEAYLQSKYTHGYDDVLNAVNRQSGYAYENLDPSYIDFVKKSSDDLNKLITKTKFNLPTNVYRNSNADFLVDVYDNAGNFLRKDKFKNIQVGESFIEPGFTSTSVPRKGRQVPGYRDALKESMKIEIPGDKQQSFLFPNEFTNLTKYREESEALLPKGLRYEKTRMMDSNVENRDDFYSTWKILNPYKQGGEGYRIDALGYNDPYKVQSYKKSYQSGGDLPSYQLKGSVNQDGFNPDIYGQKALGYTPVDYRDPKLASMLSAMQTQNRNISRGVTGMSNVPKNLPRSFVPASESTSTQGPIILTDQELKNKAWRENVLPTLSAERQQQFNDYEAQKKKDNSTFVSRLMEAPRVFLDNTFGTKPNPDGSTVVAPTVLPTDPRFYDQVFQGMNMATTIPAYINSYADYRSGKRKEPMDWRRMLPTGYQQGLFDIENPEQLNIINSLHNDPNYTKNNPFSSFAQEMGLGFWGFPGKFGKKVTGKLAKDASKDLLDPKNADELAALKRELEEMRDYTEKNLSDIWNAGANDDLKGISDIYNKNNQRWINTLKKEEKEYVNLIQNDSEIQNLISQQNNKQKRLGAKYTKKQRDADSNKIYERKRQLLIKEGYDPKITIEDAKRIEDEKMGGYHDLGKTQDDVVWDIQKNKYVADHTGHAWNTDKNFISTEDEVLSEAKHKFENYFRDKNIEENASFAEGLTDYNFQSKMLEQFRKEAMENIPNFEWSKHNDIVKEIAYKKYDEYIKEGRKSFESAFKGEPNYSSVDEEVLKYIKEFKQKGGQFNVGDEVDYETMLKLKKLGYEF